MRLKYDEVKNDPNSHELASRTGQNIPDRTGQSIPVRYICNNTQILVSLLQLFKTGIVQINRSNKYYNKGLDQYQMFKY